MVDGTCLYRAYYILAVLLSQQNRIAYSHPSLSISILDVSTLLQQLRPKYPFHLPLLLIDCYSCTNQDLHVLEQKYWNLINSFPSYTSYLCSYS